MKFHGTYELIDQKVSIRMCCFDNDNWFDLTFDCNNDQHITISLTKQQLIDLYEVSSETVETHTDHEIPYHV